MEKIYKVQMNSKGAPDFSTAVEIPSSDNHDWERYSDKLWKIAYERGKASVRPQGEWVDDDFVGQYRCSKCDYYAIDEYDYCPNCGADMRKGKDDE